MKFFRWLFLWGIMLTGSVAFAQGGAEKHKIVPERPVPPRLVNDMAHVLIRSEADELERKLVAYDDSTSSQIAIVTVPTTGDLDDFTFGMELFRDWGIGQKKKNNGILILVAVKDRRMRIITGDGLEGAIPDAVAWGIVDDVMKPAFRADQYYQGLDAAVDQLIKAAAGEYKGVPRSKRGPGGGNILGIIIIIIILLVLFGRGGGGGGGRGGRVISRRGDSVFGGILGGMIGSSLGGGGGGFGGGGGGGFGGGGFGGFGGGSSSGGGAGGSW